MSTLDVYLRQGPKQQEYALNSRLSREAGRHILSYQHQANEALSLTMPLRVESYTYDDLHPVFQMNLPEGALREALERMTTKRYGSDDLSLLAILGAHQIGRLAYTLTGQGLDARSVAPLTLGGLLSELDANLFDTLLAQYAKNSGVAGVQPKILLELKTHISLPTQHYLVKSWGPEYPHLACNEFVCLSIAKSAGLNVAKFHLSDNARLLVSKRFDIADDDGRLGFEDFCVLQGKGTRQKYDASIESCANTITQFISPEHRSQSLYDFYKLTLLNVRLRNGDAHLKNIGVIYKTLTGFRLGELPATVRQLSPVFDVVSTVPYIPADIMALSLTGSKRWPKRKVLRRFGRSHCVLTEALLDQAEEEVAEGIAANLALLDKLRQRYPDFDLVAEKMYTVMTTQLG